ncbi:hypothetical protein HDU96_008425 [Phlyctochytrium bullatum]|nr:hypothetical protein HDU96_008425 [Phlyctochytrium bullatum]
MGLTDMRRGDDDRGHGYDTTTPYEDNYTLLRSLWTAVLIHLILLVLSQIIFVISDSVGSLRHFYSGGGIEEQPILAREGTRHQRGTWPDRLEKVAATVGKTFKFLLGTALFLSIPIAFSCHLVDNPDRDDRDRDRDRDAGLATQLSSLAGTLAGRCVTCLTNAATGNNVALAWTYFGLSVVWALVDAFSVGAFAHTLLSSLLAVRQRAAASAVARATVAATTPTALLPSHRTPHHTPCAAARRLATTSTPAVIRSPRSAPAFRSPWPPANPFCVQVRRESSEAGKDGKAGVKEEKAKEAKGKSEAAETKKKAAKESAAKESAAKEPAAKEPTTKEPTAKEPAASKKPAETKKASEASEPDATPKPPAEQPKKPSATAEAAPKKDKPKKDASAKKEAPVAPVPTPTPAAVPDPEAEEPFDIESLTPEDYEQHDPGFVRNRLEEHYYYNLLEDVMALRYRHDSPGALAVEEVDARLEKLRAANEESLDHPSPVSLPAYKRPDLLAAFSVPLNQLPTEPTARAPGTVTNLHALRAFRARGAGLNVKRLWKRRLVNPIDYTTVKRRHMENWLLGKSEEKSRWRKKGEFSPLVARLPGLRKVVLKIWEESAVQNKQILLAAILSLQAITGVHATPLFAARGDAAKKIRKGMPIGAAVELRGARAYEFLDKLIQVVFPRMREWQGVDPFVIDTEAGGSGTKRRTSTRLTNPSLWVQPGSVTVRLPESVMGSFPDIEPHYEMFPRLFATTVTVHTTAADVEGAALMMSGFQMPFLEGAIPEEPEWKKKLAEEDPDADPYAKYKKKKGAGPRVKGGRR